MSKLMTHEEILWTVLRNARPDGCQAIEETISALSTLALAHNDKAIIYTDKPGNLWIDTRTPDSHTMFMAHLDTVERKPGLKKIYLDKGIVHTDGKAVLGADDGAGIAILAALLEAKVPALYLFSQNEEAGGTGGAYAALNGDVTGIERCIAYDRKGTKEICGEQCVGVLASREFVDALSAGLGLGHVWGQGTYTDNSEFQGQIPEIVNISVGYENNHGPRETLDWVYWQRLRDAVIAMDWESLPTIGPAEMRETSAWMDYGMGFGALGDYDPMDDHQTAVRNALWDIVDTLGIEPRGIEAQAIRATLDDLVAQVCMVRR